MAYERLEFPDAVEDLARLVGLTSQDRRWPRVAPARSGHCWTGWPRPTVSFASGCANIRPGNGRSIIAPARVDRPDRRLVRDRLCAARQEQPEPGTARSRCHGSGSVDAGLASRDEQGRRATGSATASCSRSATVAAGVIAFGGRALDGDTTPKYLNSPETPVFHKGAELYGLHEARIHTPHLRRLVVVEGYMDVVALAQHDIPYAVATLGTATTPSMSSVCFARSVTWCSV